MTRLRKKSNKRNGAMAILICFMLGAILILAAMCIGLTQIQLAQTEAQIVADCASISGTTMLTLDDPKNDQKPDVVAKRIAELNTLMGKPVKLSSENLVFGATRPGSNGEMAFFPGELPSNSLQVNVQLDSNSQMGSGKLLFPFMIKNPNFTLNQSAVTAQLEHDICLVLDRSGSMRSHKNPGWRYPYHPKTNRSYWYYYPHPTESRWGAVVNAIDPLINELEKTEISERLSLVSFGTSLRWSRWRWNGVDTNQNPTSNYKKVKKSAAAIGEKKPMHGGTGISYGMDRAIDILTGSKSRKHAFKTIIVLTDGDWNAGTYPPIIASNAIEKGIRVHTITFASNSGYQTMKVTAEKGGGKAYWAPNEAKLRDIFKEIGSAPPVAIIQ